MEADEKSAYYNVQVGWAPTWRISEKKFYRQCKLGWGPNMEADEKSTSNISIKTLTKKICRR